MVAAAESEAVRNHLAGLVAVVDDGGWLILLERMDHAAFVASVELAPGKARTAALFKKPSQALEDAINHGRIAAVTAQGFTEMQGGLPIVVDARLSAPLGRASIARARCANRASRTGGARPLRARLDRHASSGPPIAMAVRTPEDLIAVVPCSDVTLQFAEQWCRAPPEANTVIRALHKWRLSLEPTSRQARSDLESELRKRTITAIGQQLPQFPHGG
jgi:uncharacterized protein GlcG (DUF336 family)